MEIKDLSLPKDPDSRMLVAAVLTAAACSFRSSPDKAEPYVCAMYQRFLNDADAISKEKTMSIWTTLGKQA